MTTDKIKLDVRKLIKKMFEDAINYPDMVEIIHDAVYTANSSQDEYYVVDYIFLPKEKNIELIMAKR